MCSSTHRNTQYHRAVSGKYLNLLQLPIYVWPPCTCKAKGIVLKNNIQTIHILLTKIKELVSDEDCPYSAYKFRIINGEVFYERIEGFNEYSFLDEEYIDYIKKLYS